MLKLMSCLLSATLIFTSVTPSLAQVGGRNFGRGVSRALRPIKINGAALDRSVLENMNLTLRLPHRGLLAANSTVPLAHQILNHHDAAARALLLRSDFMVLALNRQAAPQEMQQAVAFYRSQLAQPKKLFANASLQENTAGAKKLAGAVADMASLGLLGSAEDASLIVKAYEAAVGTAAEPVVTAVAARALLRLGAYEPLEKMAASSTQQPALWEGIAQYAQMNKLPLTIAQTERVAVDVAPFASSMQELGPLNAVAVNPSLQSTALYMNAGKTPSVVLPKAPQLVAAKPAEKAAAQEPVVAAENVAAQTVDPTVQAPLHAFRDQGLATEGMEATFPVYWEDKTTGKKLDVDFHFEDQAAKEAFYKRVDLEADEFFVFDRGTGGIVIRKALTPEQRASGASPKQRGFFKVFFEGGQKTPLALYKVLFSREMVPSFEAAQKIPEVMELLSTYRADLKQILSPELLAKYPALKNYLGAKVTVLDKATIELLETGEVMQIAQDIAAELKGVLATHAGTPIKVYKDDIGHWAQNFAGFAEGTFGTMGQANTSALGLLGISKGFLSNLPTALGQFGPAWAPFIGAWAEKYGTKKLLNFGQLLGTGGHLTAAASLTAGAMGILPPIEAFAGMVGGITVNGVAGSIMKQINPMVAKQRTSDPVSSSATITDLNSWASVGGMYCYLFLPLVGAGSWLLTGSMDTTLGALAAMFGVAASIPLTANVLLRKSRIQNVVKKDAGQRNVLSSIKGNLKFGFKSPFLRSMFFATAGGHFMGLGFNSGPGHFIKENISNTSLAMAASFLSIYLTVFAGRKLGAKAMQKGFIGDKALAGLSGLIGVSMGALSLLPGLDFVTRCGLFAAAGLGFSNWVNVLQSIELSRPENIGREAAVSSMYILARTSGMLTMLMGAFGDQLATTMGLSPSTAALYALTMPLAAGTASMLINRKYITEDLWPTAKRWGISAKNWFKNKFGLGNNNPTAGAEEVQEAPAQ